MKKITDYLKTILSILGGIFLIIQLYNLVTQAKIKIESTIDINDYLIPSGFTNQFSHKNIRLNSDTLFVLIQHQSSGKLSNNTENFISNFLDNKFYANNIFSPALVSDKFGFLKIKNTGDKEIQNIQVLNLSVYYEFSNYDGTFFSGLSTGKIKVGNLSPTEEVTIKIWGIRINEDDIRITYPEGSITPDKSTKAFGYASKIVRFVKVFGIGMPLFFLFFVFLIGYYIYGIIKFDIFKKTKLS